MPRRTLLLLVVALGAVTLWQAAPALSLRPGVPHAVDFELAVGQGGARAASTRWTSPVLRAPKRFDLLGLRWRAAAGRVRVELRTRRDGARWSRWTPAPAGADHAPDGEAPLSGTDPVWAGGADALQLRVRGRVRGLRVHFVNATGTATPGARRLHAVRAAAVSVASFAARLLPGGAASARAAGAQPTIVPRSAWAGDQCRPRDTPSKGTVQMAFVHHTVGTNDYGPEDSRAIVLAICRYHRDGNGWDDIGYNFLVDRYGTIFEGRAGGIDQAIEGAQAQGYNAVSTGIANLGTYQDVPQSDAALQSIARLIAWKLPLHGVPVTGRVTVRSNGGETNRHPAGTPVTFERISGHRDGDSTECPGDALYAQLPRLREMTAARAPAVPTPSSAPSAAAPVRIALSAAAARLTFPAPVALSGRMTDGAGTPIAGAPVALQLLGATGFRTVAQATTDPAGAFAAQLPTTRNRSIRAVYAPPGGTRVASPTVPVTVAPAITAGAARRIQAGRRLVVTGTVSPRKRGVAVVAFARRGAGGPFRRTARVKALVSSGRFRALVPLPVPGLYRVRVSVARDRVNAAGRAADLYARAVRRLSGAAAARAAR